MRWCENNGVGYIFGLAGNVVLDRLVEPAADDIRVRRAESQAEVLRGFVETRYAAKSWNKERRVVARIEASASHADDMLRRGIDTSSPRYRRVMPSTFMKRTTARVGRPRTSSSSTRGNFRPIVPAAARRLPTRCG
jgi:hypothetical protein